NVTAGVNFLLGAIKPDGFISYGGGTNMYGHGIASIALAEVYGQTRDVRIRPKLEAAIKLIISCQNDQGGWRYAPRRGDADISVTVLQVVALRAAKNGGLDVPQPTIDRAVAYVRSCFDEHLGGFAYQPRSGPGFARTAAAIYSLQVCGQYDDPRVKRGSEYLFKNKADRQWFTYGNFYAAPAQYMIGGETWEKWYGDMRDLLLKTTDQNGLMRVQGELVSWEPKWDGGGRVGTIYSTAVYTMILAMPYHYLPLYQR
ncbi:MAG: prenyltransferase/squalene oxidase repeat-containing protein, partial [Tepidisphaeraceae bacterium]